MQTKHKTELEPSTSRRTATSSWEGTAKRKQLLIPHLHQPKATASYSRSEGGYRHPTTSSPHSRVRTEMDILKEGCWVCRTQPKESPELSEAQHLMWPNFMGSSWERAKCGSPHSAGEPVFEELTKAIPTRNTSNRPANGNLYLPPTRILPKNHFTSWQAGYASNNLNGLV